MRGPSLLALFLIAAGLSHANAEGLSVEGAFDWQAPAGWSEDQKPPQSEPGHIATFRPGQPCGGFDTNVIVAELASHVHDIDQGLIELKSALSDQVGDSGKIHRAEITYPGHRVNIELEYTLDASGTSPIRQFVVVYPSARRSYMVMYTVAEECFAGERDGILASVSSFQDRGVGEGQAPTLPRKSSGETIVTVVVVCFVVSIVVFVWRRFRS